MKNYLKYLLVVTFTFLIMVGIFNIMITTNVYSLRVYIGLVALISGVLIINSFLDYKASELKY